MPKLGSKLLEFIIPSLNSKKYPNLFWYPISDELDTFALKHVHKRSHKYFEANYFKVYEDYYFWKKVKMENSTLPSASKMKGMLDSALNKKSGKYVRFLRREGSLYIYYVVSGSTLMKLNFPSEDSDSSRFPEIEDPLSPENFKIKNDLNVKENFDINNREIDCLPLKQSTLINVKNADSSNYDLDSDYKSIKNMFNVVADNPSIGTYENSTQCYMDNELMAKELSSTISCDNLLNDVNYNVNVMDGQNVVLMPNENSSTMSEGESTLSIKKLKDGRYKYTFEAVRKNPLADPVFLHVLNSVTEQNNLS